MDYYQLGILDVLGYRPARNTGRCAAWRNHTLYEGVPRESLAPLLAMVGEHELLSEYEHGRVIGEQLESGEGAIYDEKSFPA